MKNSVQKILLILFVFFSSQSLISQVNSLNEAEDSAVLDSTGNTARNFLKVNLPSFILSTYSIQYEFFPTDWMSLGLSFKFTPERGMVSKEKVIEIVEDTNNMDNISSPAGRFLDQLRFRGSTLTPEIRFYLGKGLGKGFYLGPMLRFDHYKFTSEYLFQPEDQIYNLDFDGKLKSFGYGLIMGAQYPIGKSFTIDFFIGPYLSNIKIDTDSTYGGRELTDEELEILREELIEIQLPNGETDITLNNSSANVKMTSNTFPNLRAGLAFGFRF